MLDRLFDQVNAWLEKPNNVKRALALIVVFGGILRFYNPNWDGGYQGHPDEINIAKAAVKVHFFSHMDPEFYSYGGFIIYSMRAVAVLLHHLTGHETWVNDPWSMSVAGRLVVAACSTITIYFFYKLFEELINKKWGLYAALLCATTVGFIQYSHYAVSDAPLFMWLTILCYLSIRTSKNDQWFNWMLLGAASGMAIGTKTTAFAFLIIPSLTWLILFLKTKDKKLYRYGAVCAIATILAFLIISPYTIMNYEGYKAAMDLEQGIATGRYPKPFTLQFQGSPPYVLPFINLFWHMGVLMPLLGFVGAGYLLWSMYAKKRWLELLPIVITGAFVFLYIGQWYAKYIRYMVPVEVVLLITGVVFLYSLRTYVSQSSLYKWCIGIVALSSMLWTILYMPVWIRTNTKVVASDWLYTQMPNGGNVVAEAWDYVLPLNYRPQKPVKIRSYPIDAFEKDTDEKLFWTCKILAMGDYYAISSRRVYVTILHHRDQYPLMGKMYDRLFDGAIGYREVKRFTSYPGFGPFVLNDDASEETFQVYEHPVVRIFKNEKKLTEDEICKIIRG